MGKTLDELGADYRAAKASVGEHRQTQAAAEIALGRLLRANRGQSATTEIAAARKAVLDAAGDVAWCLAVTVAAGEAFKGCPIGEVPNGRELAAQHRARGLAALEIR